MLPSQSALIALLGERLGQPWGKITLADPTQFLALIRHNRLAPLIQAQAIPHPEIPTDIQRELMTFAQRAFVETTLSAQALTDTAIALADLPWVLLRGPALGADLYGDLMLRPYGDLDVLVTPRDAPQALIALRQAGFQTPPQALPDDYYQHYHLHIELRHPGAPIYTRLELHWALDHPFTLLTADVPNLVARGQRLSVAQTLLLIPEPNDLLLSLAVHLVKHAVRLPLWVQAGCVERLADDGFLLLLFDIALVLKAKHEQLNWDSLEQRAAEWGATGMLRTCLEAVESLWSGLVPLGERQRFQPARLSVQDRWLYERVQASWGDAFRLRAGLFFRPIRLLDSLAYINPPDDYLRRRYGRSTWHTRLGHGFRAIGYLTGGAVRLSYYLTKQRLSRPSTPAIKNQDSGTSPSS